MGLSILTTFILFASSTIPVSFKNSVNFTSFVGISSKLKSETKSFNSPVVTFKIVSRNDCGVGNPGRFDGVKFMMFSIIVCGLGKLVMLNISDILDGSGRSSTILPGLGKLVKFGRFANNDSGGGSPGRVGRGGNGN